MRVPQSLEAAKEKAKEAVSDAAGGPAALQTVILLAAILGLDSADKATVSAVAGSLKDAFNIGNTGIGIIISVSSFVGAVFTLPVGVLVDRKRRKTILLVAIALWTIAMVISGTATSFIYMVIARLFLGGVTAAAGPAVASLTGDFFPPNRRAQIYGLILAGELIGTGIGFVLGGEIASWLGWRWSFYLMAVPSALLVFAIWRWLREPARGGQSWIEAGQEQVRSQADVKAGERRSELRGKEGDEQGNRSANAAQSQERALEEGYQPRQNLILHQDPTGRSLWWAIGYLVRIPTYLLLVFASALVYYFFGGIRSFGMVYFAPHYHVSRSVFSALVVIVGIGAILGLVLGGRLSEWLSRKWGLRARVVLPGVSLLIAVICFAPGIIVTNVWIGIALMTAGAATLAAAVPSIDAARLDIVHTRLWGRGEAGRMFLRSTLDGSSAVVFGLVSKLLGGGNTGLMYTFLLMLGAVLLGSLFAIPLYFTYPRDVATAAASFRELKVGSESR